MIYYEKLHRALERPLKKTRECNQAVISCSWEACVSWEEGRKEEDGENSGVEVSESCAVAMWLTCIYVDDGVPDETPVESPTLQG